MSTEVIDKRSVGAIPDILNSARREDRLVSLLLWRDRGARLDPAGLALLAAVLDRFHVLHEPGWGDALGGDLAAAVGIAMRNLIPGKDGAVGTLDIVMSAVLLHLEGGNPTVATILEHGRRCL